MPFHISLLSPHSKLLPIRKRLTHRGPASQQRRAGERVSDNERNYQPQNTPLLMLLTAFVASNLC